ncbi:MAG TPA: hypothetical protein PLU35_14000 [Phycisphaerales bacterium]|nr:hypothetical protein [Phycisphaerales bacterium]
MRTQAIDKARQMGNARRVRALAGAVGVVAPVVIALQPPIAAAQNLFFGSVGFGGSQEALYTTDLDGNGLKNILPAPGWVTGVAADGAARLVFWKDHSTGSTTLNAATLTGGSHAVIATTTGGIYGVAVDRINARVYWSDGVGIRSSNHDGTGSMTVLASANTDDVEVDPTAGKVFWTTRSSGGSSNTLHVANLDGTNPQALVTLPSATIISGLTLDTITRTVFWSDYMAGTVSSMPYVGGSPSVLLSGHPFVAGLEYEQTTNRLYIVRSGAAAVSWMHPAGGPLADVFIGSGSTYGEMWDIAAVVPAPGSLALLGCGSLIALRRRR